MKPAEDMYGQDDCYIETVFGRKFYFNNPTFDFAEIAHALGNIPRYTGHTPQFYSVAEHSLLVASLMHELELGDPMEGLLHDGVEAYLCDLAAPIKAHLPDYKALDKKLDRALRLQFGLPEQKTDGCTKADWLALAIEARQLIPSKAVGWSFPPGIYEAAGELVERYPIVCLQPAEARRVLQFTRDMIEKGFNRAGR